MKKKRTGLIVAVILLLLLVAVILAGTKAIQKYVPSSERQNLYEYYGLAYEDELINEQQMAIVMNERILDVSARYMDGEVYVDYDTVHDLLNDRFYWDANENLLLYTLPDNLITVPSGGNRYQIGKENQTADYTIVRNDSNTMYMALDFVQRHTNFTYEVYESPNRVLITSEWGEADTAAVKRKTELRVKGGIKSPILREVEKEEIVDVLDIGEKWSKVYTEDGYVGYVKNKCLGKTVSVTRSNEFEEPEYTHITKDFTIEMAWHQVTTADANNKVANVLQNTKGINVISPTWFYLTGNSGEIGSLASMDYVNYCHQQGIEVWALVSNLTDNTTTEDTTYVMTHTSARQNLENQLISQAIQYNLDGINLDFEALSSEVGDGYIQFVREFSLKCANNGIVLSVDNYVPTEYTAFYNRREQANFADYIVIMAYDEHYGVDSGVGSVASIGWVTEGVENTLLEVPADQTILGCPFYTRLWSLTPETQDTTEPEGEQDAQEPDDGSDDSDEASEETDQATDVQYVIGFENLGMETAKKRLEINGADYAWSEEYGQNYGEFVNDGVIYQVWLEDAESIARKLDLMKSKQLAGCSFWKLGFETDSIWDTIIKYTD